MSFACVGMSECDRCQAEPLPLASYVTANSQEHAVSHCLNRTIPRNLLVFRTNKQGEVPQGQLRENAFGFSGNPKRAILRIQRPLHQTAAFGRGSIG